ncbi:MAG: prefoldin subunit [Nanoarchaeota archaeon]
MENQERKIQEIQILEQNLQNLLLQKQAFNMELLETKSAKKEIENAGDDVFKIIGQLMIKSDKIKIGAELSNKEKLLELRVKSLEKQEILLTEKIDSIRKEFF